MMDRSVALVTGANKGIGKEIARGLARSGAVVFLGARDAARGGAAADELAADGTVIAVELDVTDSSSIERAMAEVAERAGRLDILVNNAGIGSAGGRGFRPAREQTADDFRLVYETNLFAVVDVIHACLPLLLKAPAGRIVNVTSLRGSLGDAGAWVGQPFMAYSSSKTALNAVTAHYAFDLRDTSVRIFGAAPGHVATDFNGFRGTRTPGQGASIAIRLATEEGPWTSGAVYDDSRQLPW